MALSRFAELAVITFHDNVPLCIADLALRHAISSHLQTGTTGAAAALIVGNQACARRATSAAAKSVVNSAIDAVAGQMAARLLRTPA